MFHKVDFGKQYRTKFDARERSVSAKNLIEADDIPYLYYLTEKIRLGISYECQTIFSLKNI